jgi:aspartyl-tRNA(Asn)/glutamyl-tRNA(Gln) amidotransferase subunit C
MSNNPMALTTEQLHKLASLSRLSFSEAELAAFAPSFENIVGMVAAVTSVNTSGVQPMTSTMTNEKGETPSTPERADVQSEPVGDAALARRAALQATAPSTEMGFFVVPKIVE